jgi:hypothetical protein
MLFVFGPAPEGVFPLVSPRLSRIADEVPVVPVPRFTVSRDAAGPTSPCPDAPGAGCDCAKAPADESAKIQAEASIIFFMKDLLRILNRWETIIRASRS